MGRRVSSPQTHCSQIGVRHKLLLGLVDSRRDNAECASLLSKNTKTKTTRLTSGISKASPYSVKQE